MSTEPTLGGTVESGGFTVTSTHETSEQMTAALVEPGTEEGEPDPSKAASVLGKKGAEAAAVKRAAEAKEAKREARKQADDTEGGGEEVTVQNDETEDPGDKPKDTKKENPRHATFARMQEATRREAEAKREAVQERARRKAAEDRIAELERPRNTEPEPAPSKAADGEPQEEDFAEYRDYTKALARWEVKQELAQARAASETQYREQSRHDRINSYVGRFSQSVAKAAGAEGLQGEAFRAKIGEWNASLSPDILALKPTFKLSREDGPPTAHTWIADEIIDNTEHAPALMLHLSEHPDVYQRIAALETPRQVTRAMATLVTRLDAAPTANSSEPTMSKAKPPVRPVTGSPYSAAEPDSESGSFEDHLAYWNAKDRKRK